jgi:hypothetical protein
MEKRCVFFEVQTEFLIIIEMNCGFRRLLLNTGYRTRGIPDNVQCRIAQIHLISLISFMSCHAMSLHLMEPNRVVWRRARAHTHTCINLVPTIKVASPLLSVLFQPKPPQLLLLFHPKLFLTCTRLWFLTFRIPLSGERKNVRDNHTAKFKPTTSYRSTTRGGNYNEVVISYLGMSLRKYELYSWFSTVGKWAMGWTARFQFRHYPLLSSVLYTQAQILFPFHRNIFECMCLGFFRHTTFWLGGLKGGDH